MRVLFRSIFGKPVSGRPTNSALLKTTRGSSRLCRKPRQNVRRGPSVRVAADWPDSDGGIPSITPSNTTTASNPSAAHFHALWGAGTAGGGTVAGAGACDGTGGASRSRNVTPWLPFRSEEHTSEL